VHANFIIINLGEKTTGGYAIKVKNIEETVESIVVTIAEEAPTGMATTVMTYPMMVIKINSKKPIIFN
ncbi:protease complex subunit PrcB family protein, partial [Flavobacterium sp.]|uniref:protease complex subunit PrcB family protein n=1 Tax=Flavobacterium sp. TaxID=239 RepID=UPI0037C0CC7A